MDMDRERVTKLGAAKRQMNEAIRLFFERRDCVSPHTLASAAAQVLCDLGRAKGVASPMRGGGLIREDRRKEWSQALKKAENFFKHGDRDPDAVLEFKASQTEFTLFDATYMYASLTGRQTYEGLVFQSWFILKHPGAILDSEFRAEMRERADRLSVRADDWSLFLDLLKSRRYLPKDMLDAFD